MTAVNAVLIALGIAIVWIVLTDLFVAVVVPRPAPGRFRPSSVLVRNAWRLWRFAARKLTIIEKREGALGAFAPLAVLVMLGFWVLGLTFGFGLMLYALRSEVHPKIQGLGDAMYFSAGSLVTGFSDFVPGGGPVRVLVLIEAACGLGVVAMTITFLFSLYGAFQKREVLVVTLDSLAGAPPSGVTLLENSKRLDMMAHLDEVFDEWKVWSAEVLESHLAYPILNYFRSSHDNESWISALGAVLDASALVLTTLEEGPRGAAKLTYDVGTHLTEDLGHLFGFPEEDGPGIERFEWDQARETLAAAGYRLKPAEESWPDFAKKRSRYANALNVMARYWEIPPAAWIGDRSPVRHARAAGHSVPSIAPPTRP